jgi:hypothetical protein
VHYLMRLGISVTPVSGITATAASWKKADIAQGPSSANSGLLHRSKHYLQHARRDGQAKDLGRLEIDDQSQIWLAVVPADHPAFHRSECGRRKHLLGGTSRLD